MPDIKSDIAGAVASLDAFVGGELTTKISMMETAMRGIAGKNCAEAIAPTGASLDLYAAAAMLKQAAAQIDVVVHAIGILLCLPHILDQDEIVEYVSLGAGNAGRAFDLETTHRIAEFKFIAWKGGAESIRQNSLFKDFFLLAESDSRKMKYLYVLGLEHPLKFLMSGRSLSSVLSRGDKVKRQFEKMYGERFKKVGDYFAAKRDVVAIEDVTSYLFSKDSRALVTE